MNGHVLLIDAVTTSLIEVGYPMVIGGGCGIAFMNDNGIKIIPKLSLFGGSMLFFRTDVFIIPKFKSPIIVYTGPMFVFPISPILWYGFD